MPAPLAASGQASGSYIAEFMDAAVTVDPAEYQRRRVGSGLRVLNAGASATVNSLSCGPAPAPPKGPTATVPVTTMDSSPRRAPLGPARRLAC